MSPKYNRNGFRYLMTQKDGQTHTKILFEDVLRANDYAMQQGWKSWHIIREGEEYRVEELKKNDN